MRVMEGLMNVVALVAGRATALKHLNALILDVSAPDCLLLYIFESDDEAVGTEYSRPVVDGGPTSSSATSWSVPAK
jgi:hypothetical protein